MDTSAPLLGEPLPVELMNTIWGAGAGCTTRCATPTATEDPRPAAASDARELHAAVATLNRAAGDTPHWSALSWTPGQEPARRIRTSGQAALAAVSVVAEGTITLFSGEARHQLRACLAPGCVLYFLKNHPRREWCSAACGNRARSARHYQRHRQVGD